MLPADELGSDGHYLGGGSECIPSDRRKLGREKERRVGRAKETVTESMRPHL